MKCSRKLQHVAEKPLAYTTPTCLHGRRHQPILLSGGVAVTVDATPSWCDDTTPSMCTVGSVESMQLSNSCVTERSCDASTDVSAVHWLCVGSQHTAVMYCRLSADRTSSGGAIVRATVAVKTSSGDATVWPAVVDRTSSGDATVRTTEVDRMSSRDVILMAVVVANTSSGDATVCLTLVGSKWSGDVATREAVADNDVTTAGTWRDVLTSSPVVSCPVV